MIPGPRFKLFVLLSILSAAGIVNPIAASAQETYTESVLVNLTGKTGAYIGAEPVGNLVLASDGNFYGVTYSGGANNVGTVFKMSPTGMYTLMYSFTGGTSDGSYPYAALVEATDGNLYGTTHSGGASHEGTIYRIHTGAPNTPTILHSFAGGTTDCAISQSPLIQATDGNLYGTATGGGTSANGCVFKISLTGTYTVMYFFAGEPADGSAPSAGLLQATDGYLYGVTTGGGPEDNGAIFRMQTGAPNTPAIVSFFTGGQDDGAGPYEALIQATDGNLYGVTAMGGPDSFGTIFELPLGASSTPNILHIFDGPDGMFADSSIMEATDGLLYGTMNQGGTNSLGTLYRFQPGASNNDFSVLYSFGSGDDSAGPEGTVVQGPDGNFYGNATTGGSGSDGTIYKFTVSPTLAPAVQLTVPSSVLPGASFELSYLVYNSYVGAEAGTNNYCFATNTADDTTGWVGGITGEPTSNSRSLTAPAIAGTYTYALTCGGSETGFATLTVTAPPKVNTTTTLTSSLNPVTVGQTIILTATVSKSSGTGFAGGTVSFSCNGTSLGSATLSSGVATLSASTSGKAPYTYPIVATYSGDAADNASASSALSVVLNKAPTATTVAASPTTITPPGTVTFTATVRRSASGASGIPGGSVTFYCSSQAIGSATVNSSGVATYTGSSKGLAPGNYPVTANYSGDTFDSVSVSSAVTIVVQ